MVLTAKCRIAGEVYLANNEKNRIERLTAGERNTTVFTEPSSMLAGPTACKFDRALMGHNVLYVTTNGGMKDLVETSSVLGGVLARVYVFLEWHLKALE